MSSETDVKASPEPTEPQPTAPPRAPSPGTPAILNEPRTVGNVNESEADPSKQSPEAVPGDDEKKDRGLGGVDLKEAENQYIPPGGEEPPPAFTPYEAEYTETDTGAIISHDPHLNEDGEALYRFLLQHAQTKPAYLIYIHGNHKEQRTRRVQYTDSNGHTGYRTETYTVTITDFDFYIDLTQHIIAGPVHWSVPDDIPAYRGKWYKEVDGYPLDKDGKEKVDLEKGKDVRRRRRATDDEVENAENWEQVREAKGQPPWVGPEGDWRSAASAYGTNVLQSSKTVREWADEYCASNKRLKEFTYEKVVYGWDIDALQQAIISAIVSTNYSGNVTVNYRYSARKIQVKASNRLSRMLDNCCYKFLLIITLIYPFIWLYRRFSSKGGGKWKVCGGAYALKQWQFVDPPSADASPPFPAAPNDVPTGQPGLGTAKLVGLREGEWFQQWENTIRRAVINRFESSDPLTQPDEVPPTAAQMLDGYRGPS